MSKSLLETKVIEHCAPTLAGIKMANLFSFFYQCRQEVEQDLKIVNKILNIRGVYVEALLWKEKSVLIYVYRPKYLRAELQKAETMDLLERYGYKDAGMEQCIDQLKKRLDGYECFPHEIGVFLGYPLDDVKGFIENDGKNYKSCGMWKVYCDVGEKQKLFQKFKRCTEVYIKVFGEGRELLKMTVLT